MIQTKDYVSKVAKISRIKKFRKQITHAVRPRN